MADHAKPILTDNYTDVLSQIRGRFEDQAKGFDPANTTATNISTGTIRWNSAEKKFQKWSGTAWGDLTDNYVLSGATFSTGTANGVAYLNGSKVLTTGSALTFDGTNLGIGTTSSYAVDIRNAASTALRVGSNGNTFGSLLSWDNPSGTGRLWTLGAYDFVFGVNSTEQMRLTSTGLGIGTSSPATRLDVVGTGRFNSMEIGANNSDINNVNLNPITFKIQGTERMRLDANGNLGLGVTPQTWASGAKGMRIGVFLTAWTQSNGAANVSFGAYEGSSNILNYSSTGDAPTLYRQLSGVHSWLTAPSGTAGSTISFTQAMTLDASGNLGIGTSSPNVRLSVNSGSTATTAWFTSNNTTAYSPTTAASVENTRLNLFGGNATNAYTAIRFSHGGNFEATFGAVQNSTGTAEFVWQGYNGSAYAERMRLDANGKLILSAANQGIQFADGTTQTTAGINPATASAGAIGTMAMCKYTGTGSVSFGGTKNASELQYSDVTGTIVTIPVDGNVWRCLGRCSDAGNAQRVTIWVRVS